MLLDNWNPEWNHLKEFWVLVDTDLVIRKANPHTREWFVMQTGDELIGFRYDINPTSTFLEERNGWDIFLSTSSFTGQPIEYRIKPVEGGYIVTIKFEADYLDPARLQMRLDQARNNKIDKEMFS